MPSSTNRVSTAPGHPGQYVREEILTPKKMSVTDAAKIVGVGRPAFSNFLNGKVATTPEMAARIEHAFDVPAQTLLDMQVAHDAAKNREKGAPPNAMPYVPPFLRIKANDIEAWASPNITARIRLSVLLRTLVNSTGKGLTKVDFPGNDDAQRPGWDGYIDSQQATPWIPSGLSGWEFGTNKGIKAKADSDFAKSVNATPNKAERDRITFVFVTPRRWSRKTDWINENKAKGQWKDVRAYDSSDLEQWLEQSIAGQVWFANETLLPSNGVRSLDRAWSDWADSASPPLAGTLFASAIDGAKSTMISQLSKQPGGPTVIAADSVEEALAFLAQLFGEAGGEELVEYRDRVLVFDEPGVLPKLAQGAKGFIAVAATREVELELGPLARSIHSIVVYPRNAANADPNVVLEPLNFEAFRTSLEGMGYGRDDVTKYSNESGRSLTVLRRRLSIVPAVRTPKWAADHETATSLIPFLFIGAWSSTNAKDRDALTSLAKDEPHDALEKNCQRLAGLNDAPLWSVGTYRGVVSKIDLLFAIEGSITDHDLQRYFDMAKIVLGEDDPKLDLPDSERWAAAIHGKSREFSAVLRDGISETLVLLAVHGNHLFRGRLGFDCEHAATCLVRELLTPLKVRLLEANDRDLPIYAEAAPDAFLSILEEDLQATHPETYELMRPFDTSAFGMCARTGILWALELLAWNPETLPRSALILAQLAEIKIDDNWANKPIGSLEAIFRAWMPQTAADHDARLAVIKLLARKFPKVAWTVCVEQFGAARGVDHYSHKPRWRTDAQGFGEPFATWDPILLFRDEMITMALGRESHSQEMLSDLVERLHDLTDVQKTAVWRLVDSWADAGASDSDKAMLREKIRVTVTSRWGVKRSEKTDLASLTRAANVAYQTLEPSDLLYKHEWLFRENWVEESVDELHTDDLNLHEREARISNLQAEALREILAQRGVPGVIQFAAMGKNAFQIGRLMASRVLLPEAEIPSFLRAALAPASNSKSWATKELIRGALSVLRDEKSRASVLKTVKRALSQADLGLLLLVAPFGRGTWLMVDKLDEEHRQEYWSEVVPWIREADDERNEAIERLLAVRRPRAAFACASRKLEAIKPELVFRLMLKMTEEGKDESGHYPLEQYDIEQAFELMGKSPELTLDEMAGLEFAYIEALSRRWSERGGYGIPNLEKYVDAHPELFIQAVVWTSKRTDGGEDPNEWKVAPEDGQRLAERGHNLLEGIDRIPGNDNLGELRANLLVLWIKTVRDACGELGRLDIADVRLGRLLSGAPKGNDGVWPCEPVRQVLEDIHSTKMMDGAHTGLYNSRGVIMRGEGGGQERELADGYRTWANALQYSHPFVASDLLMKMVRTYEHEACDRDSDTAVGRRLR